MSRVRLSFSNENARGVTAKSCSDIQDLVPDVPVKVSSSVPGAASEGIPRKRHQSGSSPARVTWKPAARATMRLPVPLSSMEALSSGSAAVR